MHAALRPVLPCSPSKHRRRHVHFPYLQEVLETTLSRRFQRHVPVMGAGRTDSGVHAVGQAIHFDLPKADTDLGELTYVMNQMMPEVWYRFNLN